jgi:hypothetical protein
MSETYIDAISASANTVLPPVPAGNIRWWPTDGGILRYPTPELEPRAMVAWMAIVSVFNKVEAGQIHVEWYSVGPVSVRTLAALRRYQSQYTEVVPDYTGALEEFREWMEACPASELARACVHTAEHRFLPHAGLPLTPLRRVVNPKRRDILTDEYSDMLRVRMRETLRKLIKVQITIHAIKKVLQAHHGGYFYGDGPPGRWIDVDWDDQDVLDAWWRLHDEKVVNNRVWARIAYDGYNRDVLDPWDYRHLRRILALLSTRPAHYQDTFRDLIAERDYHMRIPEKFTPANAGMLQYWSPHPAVAYQLVQRGFVQQNSVPVALISFGGRAEQLFAAGLLATMLEVDRAFALAELPAGWAWSGSVPLPRWWPRALQLYARLRQHETTKIQKVIIHAASGLIPEQGLVLCTDAYPDNDQRTEWVWNPEARMPTDYYTWLQTRDVAVDAFFQDCQVFVWRTQLVCVSRFPIWFYECFMGVQFKARQDPPAMKQARPFSLGHDTSRDWGWTASIPFVEDERPISCVRQTSDTLVASRWPDEQVALIALDSRWEGWYNQMQPFLTTKSGSTQVIRPYLCPLFTWDRLIDNGEAQTLDVCPRKALSTVDYYNILVTRAESQSAVSIDRVTNVFAPRWQQAPVSNVGQTTADTASSFSAAMAKLGN